jgi:phosphonate degradation associated HDIG domain protein
MNPSVSRTLSAIEELFAQHGQEAYFGENVSQFEHAAQAAELARKAGFDEEVQLAAFLHDIGHLLPTDNPDELMDEYGRRDHEGAAAAWLLERGFSERVTALIEHHVNAKRYLTYKQPAYFDTLSEASLRTLEFQGGPMQQAEAEAFEQHPHFDLILRMRRWDEAAKIQEAPTPAMPYYLNLIEAYLTRRLPSEVV